MSKPVVLTGLRANNDLHIGNYFGALLPMIDMAHKKSGEYQINLFVPDLHSFTTPIDHSQLHDQILHNLRLFVAAGLDLSNPDIYIYRQSHISAHSELTWILDCFTGFGEMNRMTQFKDKSGLQETRTSRAETLSTLKENHAYWHTFTDEQKLEKIEQIQGYLDTYDEKYGTDASVGLFNYPVLMAADILLYDASYVPVGEDQTQHLEFTRDIAQRMNSKFDELFTVPLSVPKQHEFFGKDQGLRIRDLIDPTKKMSKSDETGKGVIFLGDDPAAAAKKIMSATTDSFGQIKYDLKERPGITSLLQILALLSGHSQEEVNTEWEGKTSYGDFKKAVADAVSTFLIGFQSRLSAVDDQALLAKLETSETAMRQTANQTLLRAQQAVGLRAKN